MQHISLLKAGAKKLSMNKFTHGRLFMALSSGEYDEVKV
jgi:hypothetical protein